MHFLRLVLTIILFPTTLLHAAWTPRDVEPIVFQPQFRWSNHTCTQQGTGSFIRAPNGEIVGLTSAHFINFSGPQLLKVEWLDIRTERPIATSIRSWGMPGHEGQYDPLDLRSDYLLMVIDSCIDPENILELDDRKCIELGERIWFPNKDPRAESEYDLIEGQVSEVAETYIIITLDQIVDLQARSGSPILSQKTGKVIGILTGGGKNLLYLAPSSSIHQALLDARQYPLLKNVIGSKKDWRA